MQRDKLVRYLDDYLHINDFADYGPQRLQVEGRPEVNKITLSVDAARPVLEAAVKANSDFHLVHHGILWGELQLLAGPLGQRVRTLMQADLNLYGVHLALDAHPEVGNNVVLARMLNIGVSDWWAEFKGKAMGIWGEVPAGMQREELVERINTTLKIEARVAAFGPQELKKVGIVSGGASSEIVNAAKLGLDTYITGEMTHSFYWEAAENQINVIYAGHYASETVGVKALGDHLAEKFGLETYFLDFPTGL